LKVGQLANSAFVVDSSYPLSIVFLRSLSLLFIFFFLNTKAAELMIFDLNLEFIFFFASLQTFINSKEIVELTAHESTKTNLKDFSEKTFSTSSDLRSAAKTAENGFFCCYRFVILRRSS
jgi:hypothetical protein